MKQVKRVAVLTSGGDAPGMHAAIRAVVRKGIYDGLRIFGVENGYNGLINGWMHEMDERSVADIIHRGGTILSTARCEEFKTRPGQEKAFAFLRQNQIDGVIAIGGDGSFMGAKVLSENGFATIGLPGTIDNDLAYTDFTIGFDTAVNTVIDAINKVRDTMTSHGRVSIVEVMGRNCGDIAVYSGITGGAEVVLVPEVPWTLDEVCEAIARGRARGKLASIIILAEGTGHAAELEKAIGERMQLDVRSVVLGHIQRGGFPTASDRLLASRMGARAVDLLGRNIGNRVVGIRKNEIFDMDIMDALAVKRHFDMDLYSLVTELSR